MPPKVAHVCTCDPAPKAHTTDEECDEEQILQKNLDRCTIMLKVMLGSRTIDIFVGANHGKENVYTVHQDLITLHSGYVRRLLLGPKGNENNKVDVELDDIKPDNFASFVCWMYYGTSLNAVELQSNTQEQELWSMGRDLEAPAFQNYCMIFSILKDYKEYSHHWMIPTSVESVYEVTAKDSLLRKLAADIANACNPFKKPKPKTNTKSYKTVLKEYNKEQADWEELRQRCPDFDADIRKPIDERWKGNARPWDRQFRQNYLEKETPLLDAWRNQVAARRSLAEIKKGAAEGDVQSKIERALLK